MTSPNSTQQKQLRARLAAGYDLHTGSAILALYRATAEKMTKRGWGIAA